MMPSSCGRRPAGGSWVSPCPLHVRLLPRWPAVLALMTARRRSAAQAEEVFLAGERDELDQLLLRRAVEAATVAAGVGERVDTDRGRVPTATGAVARSDWKMALAGQQASTPSSRIRRLISAVLDSTGRMNVLLMIRRRKPGWAKGDVGAAPACRPGGSRPGCRSATSCSPGACRCSGTRLLTSSTGDRVTRPDQPGRPLGVDDLHRAAQVEPKAQADGELGAISCRSKDGIASDVRLRRSAQMDGARWSRQNPRVGSNPYRT